MCADLYSMPLRKLHGVSHVIAIGTMEPASHIGDGDQRHDVIVVFQPVKIEGFTQVAVEDRHSSLPGFQADVLVPQLRDERQPELIGYHCQDQQYDYDYGLQIAVDAG